jgi:hypothetical protein
MCPATRFALVLENDARSLPAPRKFVKAHKGLRHAARIAIACGDIAAFAAS